MIGKPLRGITGLHPISLGIEVAPIEASNTQPNTAPPASTWNKVLEMKFNYNFADSTGRHSPVSYEAVVSSAQSVEGGCSMYAYYDGTVYADEYGTDNTDFNFTSRDWRVSCDIYPTDISNSYVWAKTSGGYFGLCLQIDNTYVAGKTVIFVRHPANGTVGEPYGTIQLDDIVGKWTNIVVERVGDVFGIYIDGVKMVDVSGINETNTSTSGSGYNGFQICGNAGSYTYAGYIDNFVVQTK